MWYRPYIGVGYLSLIWMRPWYLTHYSFCYGSSLGYLCDPYLKVGHVLGGVRIGFKHVG